MGAERGAPENHYSGTWNSQPGMLAQGDSRRHGGRLGGLGRQREVSPILSVWTQHELKWLRIVEETGPRMFGLEESDVMERRGYVNHVKQEIEVRLAGFFVHFQADNRP